MLELLRKQPKVLKSGKVIKNRQARSFRAMVVEAPKKFGWLIGKEAVASPCCYSLELEFEDGGILTTSSVKEVSENVVDKTITYRTMHSIYTVKVLELL